MPVPVISIAQMREWERVTWATGQTEREVIFRVGKRVAQKALEMSQPGERLLLLCGKGNNGQDVLSAKEHLADRRTDVLQVTEPSSDAEKLQAVLASGPTLVVDGLFGIGLNRSLSADWCRFIEKINGTHKRVLAIDVPSGLNADTGEPLGVAIRAEVTLTVGAPKRGMLRDSAAEFVGRLEVAHDVGLASPPEQADLWWTLPEDFASFPPRRPVATHKGTYGHVAIIAGSLGYHGAAVLVSRGAQRSQPGLITLYTMPQVYSPVASQLQAVMVSPWQHGAAFPSSCTGFVAGPGLAGEVPPEIKQLVRQLWSESDRPVLVDATALDWIANVPCRKEAVRVITPHPGEAARMLGTNAKQIQANRPEALRQLSAKLGNVWVVLKGHQTLVGRSTEPLYVNPSGNPHLAQGGSGDLLSGYIAGLLAQPSLAADPLTLLRYAVWQHGRAADELQRTGRAWIIEDLAEALGSAW